MISIKLIRNWLIDYLLLHTFIKLMELDQSRRVQGRGRDPILYIYVMYWVLASATTIGGDVA